MANNFEDFDLTGDPINIIHIDDLVFLEHFDSYFLAGERVSANLYFSECALAEVTTYRI